MSNRDPREICFNCVHWLKTKGHIERGQCRRYPPKMQRDIQQWPITKPAEWCGEFSDTEGSWKPS